MIKDRVGYKARWTIRRFKSAADHAAGKAYSESHIEGNLLLNEGIAPALDLWAGIGTPTAFDNANARLGVGDSSAAEAASQTDLQAATNKTYKGMEASYPSRAAQTLTWRAIFGSADANYAWNEFSCDNGATAQQTLNRKVSAQGIKAAGQTWQLDLTITLS